MNRIGLISLILACTFQLSAQHKRIDGAPRPKPDEKESKNMLKKTIKDADYVFEGRVVEVERFVVDSSIYYHHTIVVEYVYEEKEKLEDTIALVSKFYTDEVRNMLRYDKSLIDSCAFKLMKNNRYLLMMHKGNGDYPGFYKTLPHYKVYHKCSLDYQSMIYISGSPRGMGRTWRGKYKEFWEEVEGYGLKKNEPKKKTEFSDSLKLKRKLEQEEMRRKLKRHRDLMDSVLEIHGTGHLKTNGVDDPAVFYISDEKITRDNNVNYLEFDLKLTTGNIQFPYLNLVNFDLSYGTALIGGAFYNNMVSNNRVEVTIGEEFHQPTYELLLEDKTNSIMNVALTSNGTSGTPNQLTKTLLDFDDPKTLLHFKMEIKSCGDFTQLQVIEENPTPQVWTASSSDFDFLTSPFEELDILSAPEVVELNVETCIPIIEEIVQDNFLVAGIGQTIEIKGNFFGEERVSNTIKGELSFYDANTGVYSPVPIDEEDYVSWTDDKIIVKVPSESVLEEEKPVTAGTGPVFLVNFTQQSTESNLEVLINHSIINIVISDKKKPTYFTARSGESDIEYVLSDAIAGRPSAVETIELAFQEWSCRIPINIVLKKDGLGNPITIPNASAETYEGFVIYEKELDKDVLMQTEPNYANYPIGIPSTTLTNPVEENRFSQAYAKIAVSTRSDVEWHYSATGDLPIGKDDFYFTTLHELGHVLYADHVLTRLGLMQPGAYYDEDLGTPEENRLDLSGLNGDAVRGVAEHIERSMDIDWINGVYRTIFSTTSPYCPVSGVENIFSITSLFNVYPNPANEEVIIINNKPGDYFVQLKDINGITLSDENLSDTSTRIDTSGYNNGLYFLMITSMQQHDEVYVAKLIIQH